MAGRKIRCSFLVLKRRNLALPAGREAYANRKLIVGRPNIRHGDQPGVLARRASDERFSAPRLRKVTDGPFGTGARLRCGGITGWACDDPSVVHRPRGSRGSLESYLVMAVSVRTIRLAPSQLSKGSLKCKAATIARPRFPSFSALAATCRPDNVFAGSTPPP